VRQLDKLIDVVEVEDLRPANSIRRELVLLQVDAVAGQRSEIIEIVQVLGARVAHLDQEKIIIEFMDEPERVERLIANLSPYGVKEIVRTGTVAIGV
jgi:acetolactate synthase-1/3 small subunit